MNNQQIRCVTSTDEGLICISQQLLSKPNDVICCNGLALIFIKLKFGGKSETISIGL